MRMVSMVVVAVDVMCLARAVGLVLVLLVCNCFLERVDAALSELLAGADGSGCDSAVSFQRNGRSGRAF